MKTLRPVNLISLYISQWQSFALLLIVTLSTAVTIYVFKIPFTSSGSIVANNQQNSGLQAFSISFSGLNKSVVDSKKGNSILNKHLEYLRTQDFFVGLQRFAKKRGESQKITIEEAKGFALLKAQLDENDSFVSLADKVQFKLESDFQISVTAKSTDRYEALFLANSALEFAQIKLKEKELLDLEKASDFIKKQKELSEANLKNLSSELAKFESNDDQLLPLASQQKMGEYISDLLVRANEIKLKMSENQKLISMLSAGKPTQRESKLYGVGGRIETLRIENNLLSGKLAQVNESIEKLKKQTKQLPFTAQMVNDLKKKSEIEFSRYKELSTAESGLVAQKLSLETRFEVLEKAYFETTRPQVSLMILVGLSILISQLIGSLIVYFKYLWNPDTITAEAERNLVIFNDDFNPRVIIEKSKINFKLNNIKHEQTTIEETNENSEN